MIFICLISPPLTSFFSGFHFFSQQESCKKEESLKSVVCVTDEVILVLHNYNLFQKTTQC